MLLAGLAIAVPYYWLLIDNGPGAAGVEPSRLDIARLRDEADALPGAKPTSVTYEVVASRSEPGTLLVAGGGLKRHAVGAIVFRLHSASGDTVIDSGMGGKNVASAGFTSFYPRNWAVAQRDMLAAAHIVFTSERQGAMDGLLKSPRFAELAPKVKLGIDQGPRAPGAALLPWPDNLGDLGLADKANAVCPIAPGIVQISAPGYSAGSQMYFVRYENGQEMLFAGEVVPMRRNLDWMRLRSRYDTDLRNPSDRGEQRAWLAAVAALKRSAPNLVVVPGHDQEWLKRLEVRAVFGGKALQPSQPVVTN